ncbi:cilia- and flagella-associated protein 251-like [Montipora foliosa]|uniref:cilia- and flagella-associated protein 251-like n=1 Tax=Montipora foliosa TaxID=591990 RepID=UPI0035F10F3B
MQERVKIRKEQEEDLEKSLLEDRKKAQATAVCEGVHPTERCCDDRDAFENKIRNDRRKRVTPEPEEGTTIVLRLNDQKISRKFQKNATFQEVYDWAGAMSVMPLFFTLQRRSEVVLHSHCIEGEEVLDIYERNEDEVKSLLYSQVSFKGNVPFEHQEELETTVNEKQGKDATKKKNEGSQKRFKKHGGKEDRDKREKTEREQVQPEQEALEKDDEEGHCNIPVAIKEQQEKNTVDSNRKRKKEKRTGSQRKKLKATHIDA